MKRRGGIENEIIHIQIPVTKKAYEHDIEYTDGTEDVPHGEAGTIDV